MRPALAENERARPTAAPFALSGRWKRLLLLILSRGQSPWLRRCWRLALLALQLLACLFGFLLELFLQLALLLLECLRIGGRTVIRLGKIVQRQRETDRRTLHIDRLHDDVLPLLHLGDHVIGHLVVGHTANRKADAVGGLRGLALIDEQTRTVRELHAQRNGHTQHLLAAFRLKELDDGDRHAVFQTAVLGDDADLLVVGVRSLAADLHPGRIHQLWLFAGGLLLSRRSGLSGLSRLSRLRRLGRLRSRRLFLRRCLFLCRR